MSLRSRGVLVVEGLGARKDAAAAARRRAPLAAMAPWGSAGALVLPWLREFWRGVGVGGSEGGMAIEVRLDN